MAKLIIDNYLFVEKIKDKNNIYNYRGKLKILYFDIYFFIGDYFLYKNKNLNYFEIFLEISFANT
jgi:hypothetical protein